MTAVAPWAPAKLYPTGAICVPRTNAAGSALPAFTNPGFETGDDTGWEFDAGVTVTNETRFSGSYCVKFTGSSGQKRCFSTLAAAAPGMKVRATAQYKQGAASSGHNTGAVTNVSASGEGSGTTVTLRDELSTFTLYKTDADTSAKLPGAPGIRSGALAGPSPASPADSNGPCAASRRSTSPPCRWTTRRPTRCSSAARPPRCSSSSRAA